MKNSADDFFLYSDYNAWGSEFFDSISQENIFSQNYVNFSDEENFQDIFCQQTSNLVHYNKKGLFSTKSFSKCERRDYYIKKVKVYSISKQLIQVINQRLKSHYKIKKRIQKPSQSFIKETSITLNRYWLNYTVEKCLTSTFDEYYSIRKNIQCIKKVEKNIKIFNLLHSKKHIEEFSKDRIFQRTIKEVIQEYLESEQFFVDQKKEKDPQIFEMYLKGNKEKKCYNIIDYLLKTPGNKSMIKDFA